VLPPPVLKPPVLAPPWLRAVSRAWARGVEQIPEWDSTEPALFAERALREAPDPRRERSLRGKGERACQLGTIGQGACAA
jgi:hypothetical protein